MARSTTFWRFEIRMSSTLDDLDLGPAWADAVDGLETGGEDRGLHLVERRGDDDLSLALALPAVDLDLDAADTAGFLKVAEVELVSEQALRLAEHRSDDVRFVDDAFGADAGSDLVLCGAGVVGHVGSPCWKSARSRGASSGDGVRPTLRRRAMRGAYDRQGRGSS